MPTISGVIFDMDGVLCDSEPFIRAAAMRMFEEIYHLKVEPEDFHPFVGAGEDRFIGGVAEKYGVKLVMPRDKIHTYDIYLRIIQGQLRPLPGAIEFIKRCRERGLRLAVASSADRIKVDGNLQQIGISLDRFDAIVSGDDVERKKPDSQIFQLAAQRLGLAPTNCLVVEDAPNGIRAAKASGSLCLGITTTFDEQTLRGVGADFTAPDLAHVPAELPI